METKNGMSGKVIFVCPPRGGVSKKNGTAWKMQEYVLETQDQFPKRCIFSVWGEDKINEFDIKLGDVVNAYFDIDAREYNGRWYNDIRAWRVDKVGQQQQKSYMKPAPTMEKKVDGVEEPLPF